MDMAEEGIYSDIGELFRDSWSLRKVNKDWDSFLDKLILNKELKEKYKKHGTCKECRQPHDDHGYGNRRCQICNFKHLLQVKDRRITELEEELQIEREEAEKALEKAKEWRERQLREITEQKDNEIKQLKAENTRLQQRLNSQQTAQILQSTNIPKRGNH